MATQGLKTKKNVEMGYMAGGKFHPIRASKDYSEVRAGEGDNSAYHLAKAGRNLRASKSLKKRLGMATNPSQATTKTTATKKTTNGVLTNALITAAADKVIAKMQATKKRRRKAKNPSVPNQFQGKPSAAQISAVVNHKYPDKKATPYVVVYLKQSGNVFSIFAQGYSKKSDANAFSRLQTSKGFVSVKVLERVKKTANRKAKNPDETLQQLFEKYEEFQGVPVDSYMEIEVPEGTPENLILVGDLPEIDYITRKAHIENGERVHYEHQFGEENGETPYLLMDVDERLHIGGGDYYATERGLEN